MAVQQSIGRMLWGKLGILTVSSYEILELMDFCCREVILFPVERKCLLWLNIWAISFWRGRKYEKCSLQEFAVFYCFGDCIAGDILRIWNNNIIWMKHDPRTVDRNDRRNLQLHSIHPSTIPPLYVEQSISSLIQPRLFSLYIPAMDFILLIIRSNSKMTMKHPASRGEIKTETHSPPGGLCP